MRLFVNKNELAQVEKSPLSSTIWKSLYPHTPIAIRSWMSLFIHRLVEYENGGGQATLEALVKLFAKQVTNPIYRNLVNANQHECLKKAIHAAERKAFSIRTQEKRDEELTLDIQMNTQALLTGNKDHLREAFGKEASTM